MEKRIQNRPNAGAMQNVLPARGVAPKLQQAMRRLENSINRDSVAHLLESRPEPEDLVKAGITKPTNQASRIQQMAQQLERNMTSDSIGHQLENRPDIDELRTRAILSDQRVAPALQNTQRTLQQNLAKANLYHALKYRPSVDQLVEKGLYPADYLDEDSEDYGDDEEYYSNGADIPLYDGDFDNAYIQYAADYHEQYGVYPDPGEFYAAYHGQQFDSEDEEGYDDDGQYNEEQTYGDYGDTNEYYYEQEADDYSSDDGAYYEQEADAYEPYYEQAEEPAVYYDEETGEYYTAGVNEDDGEYYEEEYEEAAEPYYEEVGDYEEDEYDQYEDQNQRRSKNFHLTRILLKFVASMAEAGEINIEQKGWLKDLIVDQDTTILAVAETFDAENDLNDFKDSMLRLAQMSR